MDGRGYVPYQDPILLYRFYSWNKYASSHLSIELNHNTVLFTFDGLHELFNQEREMFGWERVKSTFEKYADLAPKEITDWLSYEVDFWRGDKPIDDDITFEVMQFR